MVIAAKVIAGIVLFIAVAAGVLSAAAGNLGAAAGAVFAIMLAATCSAIVGLLERQAAGIEALAGKGKSAARRGSPKSTKEGRAAAWKERLG